MSNVVIKVENISKQYRLGTVGTGTFSHDLNRFWANIRGKEDPYLKIGENNDRTRKGDSEYVWALNDTSFEVKQGEVLGIIGRNGAGKSTLLKILSQITRPTTGSVKMKGRVGSLLEVGTGFHPDLTGRENVYINGAILGMRKWEIDKKLDEIISFAGVERYIDTPVKRYSSGMMVRLGFSVAAHLEPEILIVDEVLAVGDFDFQKRCMDRMQNDVKSGRTIIFVSHNFEAISSLTTRCILLENGVLTRNGPTSDVLNSYLGHSSKLSYERPSLVTNEIAFIKWMNFNQSESTVRFLVAIKEKIKVSYSLEICTSSGIVIYTIRDTDSRPDNYLKAAGEYECSVIIPTNFLVPGNYYINVSLAELGIQRFEKIERAIIFDILVPEKNLNEISTRTGLLRIESTWSETKI